MQEKEAGSLNIGLNVCKSSAYFKYGANFHCAGHRKDK